MAGVTFKFSRNRVPVVNRRERPSRLSTATKLSPRNLRIGVVELGAILLVSLIFLMTISMPVRNYFEQRNEIKETTAAIAQKQQRKEQLLGELNKYKSDAYVEEQARNRLGVIAPGEVAFRILDPAMQGENSVTSKQGTTAPQSKPWFDTLWGSIASPESAAVTGQIEAPAPEMHMPIKPTAPVEAPAQQ